MYTRESLLFIHIFYSSHDICSVIKIASEDATVWDRACVVGVRMEGEELEHSLDTGGSKDTLLQS